MKTYLLLLFIGLLALPANDKFSSIKTSVVSGAQEHPCPPYNQEAYDYLVEFATYSFPHSYEGITADAIPPEEIQWLAFDPKCENFTAGSDGYITSLFKSNQYYFDVFLFTEHVTFIDDETFTFRLEPSFIIVFDENWDEIGTFLI